MRLALQLVSVVVSLLAAWLWLRASRLPPPLSSFEKWAASSARWNSWAARCTAVAVVLQAASGVWR